MIKGHNVTPGSHPPKSYINTSCVFYNNTAHKDLLITLYT